MTVLIRLINYVKKEILKYKNEYTNATKIYKIIKDKNITYYDEILKINFSSKEILLAFDFYKQRGQKELIFCISVPEEMNIYDSEKKYYQENFINEEKIIYEALTLENTYKGWIKEEEKECYKREAKKKDCIEFLKKYYPEILLN